PLLTVRLPGLEHRSPIRVIIDSRLRIPLSAHIVTGAREVPTWVVTTVDAPIETEKALVERGVEVMRVPAGEDGRVVLLDALELLGTRGLTRVFSEGGPAVADALAQADLIDELILATGRSARGEGDVPAIGPALLDRMEDLRLVGDEQIGTDLFMYWEKD